KEMRTNLAAAMKKADEGLNPLLFLGLRFRDFEGIDVTRLLRSSDKQDDQSLVFVDRAELTARQEEVLETAHRMGYFEHPKDANAGEVADALGITTSTFTEHLAAAQRKLLHSILDR
ncbi:MAG: helix-turn-helix domain-containing protein, partial [Halobacteriales archaeon]|nr:helix-turn-helix domain-containing protein [Halobacteriales archaeon]